MTVYELIFNTLIENVFTKLELHRVYDTLPMKDGINWWVKQATQVMWKHVLEILYALRETGSFLNYINRKDFASFLGYGCYQICNGRFVPC